MDSYMQKNKIGLISHTIYTNKHKMFWLRLYICIYIWASLVVQVGYNPPAVWETWVQSFGWEDSLEDGLATHSSILAWRISMDWGAWQATVHGVVKSWTWLGVWAQHSTYMHMYTHTHTHNEILLSHKKRIKSFHLWQCGWI